MTEHVRLSTGPSETVLPDPPQELVDLLDSAVNDPKRLAEVVAKFPSSSLAWSRLALQAREAVEIYAYARVGYHRGLDALRGAGWKGTGYVKWAAESNRGFLACLELLRRQAEVIGETAEAERCALFLRQLDPEWSGLPD